MKIENGKLKKYKLGEIGNVCMCKRILKEETNTASGIPFYKIGTFGNKADVYITKEKFEEYKNKFSYPKKGDILISAAGTIGRTVIYDGSDSYFQDSNIVWIDNDETKVLNKYLFYCYKNIHWFTSKGSTILRLYNDNIRNTEIIVPPLESQQKIAAVLSALDDKIALNRRMNAKLEQMAKRLYDHWFVQFDFPVSCHSELVSESHSEEMLNQVQHDERIKPYKSFGGKMVWNETLKREIPEGWEVKKLGELFTTNRGVSYSTKTITGEIGIPMINLASFSPDGSYKIDGIKIYTGEYTEEKVLKPFDLVMCNTLQTAIDFSKDIIGKALLVPDIFEGDITSSHHVNTLKTQNEKLKFYLYRLFNTYYFHAYISHYASGTNIMGLDFAGVENYSTVIPSEEILSKFADFILDIEKKKSEIIRENKKLISLRERLLPLLMNGQVIVN